MKWMELKSLEQVKEINSLSAHKKVMLFKHSTRCSISSAALGRIERNWKPEYENEMICYFLDLIQFRELSNHIAENYEVIHQSPQALVIRNSKCTLSQSHNQIRLGDLLEA